MTKTNFGIRGILATALVAAFALPVLAQGPGGGPGGGPCGGPGGFAGHPPMMMNGFDTDDDGKITVEEFKAGHSQRFAMWDTNGDGKVTVEEMKATWQGRNPARAEKLFARLDSNGDGVVTIEEFTTKGDAMFARLDANNDGVLTEDELPVPGPGRRGPGRPGGPGAPVPGTGSQ